MVVVVSRDNQSQIATEYLRKPPEWHLWVMDGGDYRCLVWYVGQQGPEPLVLFQVALAHAVEDDKKVSTPEESETGRAKMCVKIFYPLVSGK